MLGNTQAQGSINTAFPLVIDFLDQENAFNQENVLNQGSVASKEELEHSQRQSLAPSSTFSNTNSQEATNIGRKVVVAENNTYYLQQFAPNTYWFVCK